MARYDAEWQRFHRGGYDRPLRHGWEWSGGRPAGPGRGAYDVGYSVEDGWRGAEGVYGPVRYGLGPYHQRLRTRRRPDDEIRGDVEEALFYDTWVDAEAIRVQVQDGIVTLQGELPNYEEIRYATDDAWDVEGVLGVRSELKVRER